MLARLGVCLALLGITSCRNGRSEERSGAANVFGGGRPDEPPVLVNRELPFRYPAPLYARRVQANVVLRLFVDTMGGVVAESTRVEETSGYGALDSAAVMGSQDLFFIPAKLHGEPLGVSVLFPVYFRHPEAAPLPGDTILAKREETGGRSKKAAGSAPPAPPSRRP